MRGLIAVLPGDGVGAEVTAQAVRVLEAVAEEAIKRATGARGLRAILEEVLLDVMYDLPGRDDIDKVVIDRETVIDKVEATLITRDTDERAAS